jgi:hypothetical protein
MSQRSSPTCDAPRCRRDSRTLLQGGYTPFCSYHECQYDKCHRQQTDASDSKYCIAHECSLSRCRGKRTRDSKFCVDHKCCSECVLQRSPTTDSDFCPAHECSVSNCPRKSSMQRSGGTVCAEHRCTLDSGCINKRTTTLNSLFCQTHECSIPNCVTKIAFRDGRLCYSHVCKERPCQRQCADPSVNYCNRHKHLEQRDWDELVEKRNAPKRR